MARRNLDIAIDFRFELSYEALWIDVKRQGLLDTEFKEPQILYFYTHIWFIIMNLFNVWLGWLILGFEIIYILLEFVYIMSWKSKYKLTYAMLSIFKILIVANFDIEFYRF